MDEKIWKFQNKRRLPEKQVNDLINKSDSSRNKKQCGQDNSDDVCAHNNEEYKVNLCM